jgi:hypothetical protein
MLNLDQKLNLISENIVSKYKIFIKEQFRKKLRKKISRIYLQRETDLSILR